MPKPPKCKRRSLVRVIELGITSQLNIFNCQTLNSLNLGLPEPVKVGDEQSQERAVPLTRILIIGEGKTEGPLDRYLELPDPKT